MLGGGDAEAVGGGATARKQWKCRVERGSSEDAKRIRARLGRENGFEAGKAIVEGMCGFEGGQDGKRGGRGREERSGRKRSARPPGGALDGTTGG